MKGDFVVGRVRKILIIKHLAKKSIFQKSKLQKIFAVSIDNRPTHKDNALIIKQLQAQKGCEGVQSAENLKGGCDPKKFFFTKNHPI